MLEKRFRYRSLSGAPLEDHASHWANFTWQAGPVCVINKGGPWGVLQVWAASAEEGKRVIQHAAAIAGIDLTRTEWVVSSSKNPRFGRTGSMALKRLRGGALAVSMREGSDGLPEVMAPDPYGSGPVF
jgi:hypothetical protein